MKFLTNTTNVILITGFVLCYRVFGFAQVQCNTYMDAGPVNRTTGYGEENIKQGIYEGVAQRYNNLNGSITAIKLWGRSNTISNTVKVVIYNQQSGSGLPGVILGQTTVNLAASSTPLEIMAVLGAPVNLSGTNVTLISVEPVNSSADDFFIQHNQGGDNDSGTSGDGQGLFLNLVKQGNVWYKNLANGDLVQDYDFLILPVASLPITSDFTYTATGLSVSFTNTSTNASYYYWDFGDSTNSSSASPSHSYSSSGIYNVNLKALGADSSCFDSVIKQVTVIAVGLNNNLLGQKKISIDNPVKNELKITSNKSNLNYKIYNILGEPLLSGRLNDDVTNIAISYLKEGLYFINFENMQIFKFIKN